MYDIHCHLIYGEDDGSRSIEESIEMIKIYKSIGYEGSILTSHYDESRYLVTSEKTIEKMNLIKERLNEEKIEFELFPGNEIQINENTIDLIKNNKILRLNNSRYVLCELPFLTRPLYAEEIFYRMQLEGWIPIIAHPERYKYIESDMGLFNNFIKSGCLLQLNLSSLTSKSLAPIAKELLERNMIHFVATDSHQSKWRNPNVKDELDKLKALLGEEKFLQLTTTNPEKVIKDQFISSAYDKVIDLSDKVGKKKKKRWFEFWR
ncbi:MAG: protein tyrosine phosphatase [Peptoniphilaceae bacterium]|nr:protein tyrosine phosphatase [Peptoniphilaceae bacterium]MDY6018307.1 CpsB/CapC family capsule biosynthesis tyrosine phosphatase [Anaerococcus sp.]